MCTVNERLQSQVIDELRGDARIDASAIGVTAADGVATLFGEVPSWEMKAAAVDAAARVAGVRAVADRLEWKCPGSLRRNASDLAREVVAALREARCSTSIKAHVNDGEVRLEGFADYRFQRDAALAAITKAHAQLSGLTGVTSGVIVSEPATLPSILSDRAWNGEREGAAFSGRAHDGDAAAMRFDYALSNRQSQA